MPRDANGNYSLPLPPVIPGETIDVVWANPTMNDLAANLTDSLSRTGAGGMLAPFKAIDGSVGASGITFISEPTLGFYRSITGVLSVSVAGVEVASFNAANQIDVVRDYGSGPQKYKVEDVFSSFPGRYLGFGTDGLHTSFTGDLDTIVHNSIYSVDSATVTNAPTDFDGGGFINTLMSSGGAAEATQLLVGMNGVNSEKIWQRSKTSGTWGVWIKVSDGGAMELRLPGFGTNTRHVEYAADLDAVLINSWYSIDSAGVTNEPAGFIGFGFLHTMIYSVSADSAVQVLYGISGQVYIRTRSLGGWGGWASMIRSLGTVYQFPGLSTPPLGQGLAIANGQVLSRVTNAALWALVQGDAITEASWQTKSNSLANGVGFYSDGDGVTTFRIPDLMGEFFRAFTEAPTAARDPDRAASNLDWQVDDFKSHTHTDNDTSGLGGTIGTGGAPYRNAKITGNTGATGGNETRGRNIAMLTCIKVS